MMSLHRSDLGLLISLETLIAERNVTRAATLLGISQPALSTQLGRLRDLLGDPILVPSGRKMLPTERALKLQVPLHDLLNELQSLLRDKTHFDPKTADNTFKIAGTDYAHHVFTAEAQRHVTMLAPSVRLAMTVFDGAKAWGDLEEGRADILITSDRLTPKDAKARKLFDETFVFIQRKNHPRKKRALDLNGFCKLDHVLVSPEGGGFWGLTDEKLKSLGRIRHVATSVPGFLLAPPLVIQSDLVAVVPERLAKSYATAVDIFPVPLKLEGLSILMSWHPRRQADPAHEWLRNTLVDVAS